MAHCDNPFAQHRALNSCRAFSLLSSSLGRLIGARPGLTPPVERSSQANFDFGAEGAHLLLGRSREQRAQVRLKPEGETAIFWRLVRYHRKNPLVAGGSDSVRRAICAEAGRASSTN